MEQIGFPIYLSLKIAIISTGLVIIIGLTLGWILAKYKFPLKKLLQIIINLPLIIPPTVLGYYLLLLFGRRGFIGYWLEKLIGVRLVFHWTGGVLAAVVVSLPLFINSVRPAFSSFEPMIEDAAKVDGATTLQIFFKIILPLIKKSFIAGTALTFARSLGEFGTTLMLIGNIPGKTQTISLGIYQAVLSGDNGTANRLVFLMTLIAVGILMMIGRLEIDNED